MTERRLALIAAFGQAALAELPLDVLLHRAAVAAADGLEAKRAKVLEFRRERDDLLVRAGIGWAPGVVGRTTLSTGWSSPPGRALRGLEPVAIPDIRAHDEFEWSDLLRSHGVHSLVNVPVHAEGDVFGVLEVDAETPRAFAQADIDYLQAIGLQLGAALQRRSAAEGRAALSRRLDAVLRQMPSGVVIAAAPSGAPLLHNDRAAALLDDRVRGGGAVEDHPLYDALEPDGTPLAPEDHPLARAARHGEAVEDRRLLYRRGDGPARLLSVNAAPVRDAEGEICMAVGTFLDITAQHAAEKGLRDLSARLEAEVAARTRERDRLYQLSRDLMCVGRRDGRLLSVNPAWEAVLGWTAGELVAKPLAKFIHPGDRERTQDELARLGQGLATVDFEHRLLHRDGTTRWIAWTATPEGDRFYAVGRDVTVAKAQAASLMDAHRRLEREAAERRQAEAALIQAQKMEAVGQLTGGIAHDFNNLLTVVRGSLALLRRQIDAQPRALRLLDAAAEAATRGAKLTAQLLAFARRQVLRPRVLDVNALIEGFLPLLRQAAGSVSLALDLAPDLPACRVDPSQLEHALLNLVVNARDAAAGGRITVATRLSSDAELRRRLPQAAPGPRVEIVVADTGSGMTEAVQARAFEPFFTTKETGHGTGLGLSQVYGFVRQSGGHVLIDSTPGRGTTVRLLLPPTAQRAAAEPRAEAAPAGRTAPIAGERVLVVEDDPAVRAVAVATLEALGYRVATAEDAPTALGRLEAGDRPDILFTDVVMPGGMDGRQLAARAKAMDPELPVLLTSGYADPAGEGEAGRLPFLAKPYTPDQLAARLREVLRRRHGD